MDKIDLYKKVQALELKTERQAMEIEGLKGRVELLADTLKKMMAVMSGKKGDSR